ncbi:hypothetical protein B0H67DRAFT_640336 [Lasiosphaeris hirsuta]|uniref:GPI anchored protein n=1 Tax=Lasiosphaeris hirsuta TaxID=260670 RepID=A0AA40BDS3_9PEZI|nr:hypothetical protein B0H67DRAFT_640336 [Lasiosphaeris hirsuta]
MWKTILLALATITPVLASHHHHQAGSLAKRSDSNCKARSALKHLGPLATEFCSAYLGIPLTATVTLSETVTNLVTVVATVTISDPGCQSAATLVSRVAPRDNGVVIPPELTTFPASAISSACSRLSLVPAITVTETASVEVSSIVSVTETATVCTGSGCTPAGQPCELVNPGACCSQTCSCASGLSGCNCL